jgi:hypothetical protein
VRPIQRSILLFIESRSPSKIRRTRAEPSVFFEKIKYLSGADSQKTESICQGPFRVETRQERIDAKVKRIYVARRDSNEPIFNVGADVVLMDDIAPPR